MSEEITTRLVGIERLTNSKNGNPRYAVATSTDVLHTLVDAAVVYSLPNYPVGSDVVLTVDKDRRIIGIRAATA